jgi:CubicO group peptidase (beta-lactamase class C family)
MDNCPTPIVPVPLPEDGSLPEDISLALEDMDDFFETVISSTSLPEEMRRTIAFASCVTLNDRVLRCSNFNGSGIAQPGPATIFSIASVTKTFTAIAAFQLHERGVISLDDPIVKYLPEFSIKNPWNFNQGPITVRQALSFLSGLPRSTPCAYGCNVSSSEMFARIAEMSLGTPQWQAPRYSNLGISLVGYVVQAATGIPIDQYVQENVLNVLNMTSTGFRLNPEVIARLVPGFNDFNPGVPVPTVDFGAGWDSAAGAMYSTAEDLAKYAIALNNLGAGKIFLRDSTLAEFLLATFPNPDGSTAFGVTWLSLLFTDGARLLSKSGAVPGYMSELSIVPGRNIGLVTLYNYLSSTISTTTNNVQAIGMLLPSVDSYFVNNAAQYPVVPDYELFVGNFSQTVAMVPATVGIAQIPGSPAGVIGVFQGSALHGYLVRSPVDTHAGYVSLWFRYTVIGSEPCAAAELEAFDGEEFLFFFPNNGTATDKPALGFYLQDFYSAGPYLRQ